MFLSRAFIAASSELIESTEALPSVFAGGAARAVGFAAAEEGAGVAIRS